MFDIKDYEDDSNQPLKTFVVMYGIKNTIYRVLLPFVFFYMGFILLQGTVLEYSLWQLGLKILVAVCMLFATYSMQRKQHILFYLAFIDGIMLIKALIDCVTTVV